MDEQRDPPSSPGDEPDTGAEETTLSDEEWPVAEHYRVQPPPAAPAAASESSGRDDDESTIVVQQAAAPGDARPVRRFPPDISPALLIAVVAALLLIPAAIWLASVVNDDPGSPAATATTDTLGTTTDATVPTTPTTPTTPAKKPVPEVTGLRLADARSILERAKLRVRVRFEKSELPEGQVLRQSPSRETEVAPNTIVLLTVSGGQELVTVPSVVGLTATKATRTLRDAGLEPNLRLVRSTEQAGTVIDQSPAPDEKVDPQSVVTLDVAKPAPKPVTIEVPNLVGLTSGDARRQLRRFGLGSTIVDVPSAEPRGTVVGQSPRAGVEVREGHTVRLRVSSGPIQAVVPDVLGLDELAARQQLEAEGFEVQVVDAPTSEPAEDGTVVEQNPVGGTSKPKGSVVTITVARLG